MKTAARIQVVERTIRREYAVGVVDVAMSFPAKIVREFSAYCAEHNQRALLWGQSFSMDLSQSIIIATRASIQQFNKPHCAGVPSRKTRLREVRRLVEEDESCVVTVQLDKFVWRDVVAAAEGYEITPLEYCILAADYHAALWRNENQVTTGRTPFARFEKNLSRERRREKSSRAKSKALAEAD